jgi:hypothetical protein
MIKVPKPLVQLLALASFGLLTACGAVTLGIPPTEAGTPGNFSPTPTPLPQTMLPVLPTATFVDIQATRIAADLAQARAIEATVTAAALTPRPSSTYIPPLLDYTPPPISLPVGIFTGTDPGIRLCECTFENSWRGVVGGEYLDVFAGASSRDPQQGLVLIIRSPLNLSRIMESRTVNMPQRIGAVHIIAQQNHLLTLANAAGQQFVFDTSTLAWQMP